MGKKLKNKKKFFIKKEIKETGDVEYKKEAAFGAGMALGMFLPQILGTASNILKINI